MPTRKQSKSAQAEHSEPKSSASDIPFRGWLLGVMTALFVARPLVPSEGVAWLGDGQPFCMLWLLLGLATALVAIKAGRFPRRFAWPELLIVLFVLIHSLAALRGTTIGSPRPAFNMLWEGVAMGVSFLLARQLITTPREARAVVAAMIALAVVLSAFGYYQVFVSMPADRAEFATDPDGMLRRAGQWIPRGSVERVQFENRLRSTEPLATFALTNSLAGYLAPWLVLALGVAVTRRWPAIVVAIFIAGCLLLTKSRSGYAAVLFGLLLLGLSMVHLSARWRWKSIAIVAGTFGILLVAAITIGGVDAQVLTEAGKSLGFRLQYWQSTIAMIRDWPLLGIGPGNFQDFYTQYKLPQASEEIRDPHNWLFEIAATAGLPALAVLTLLFVAAIIVLWRADRAQESSPPTPTDKFVFGGAALALVIALVLGPLAGLPLGIERLAAGLVLGGATVWLLTPWVRGGQLSSRMLAVAVIVMLINLLAAGGIGYPAVAGSLWLLLALGLNLADTDRSLAASSKLTTLVSVVVFAVFGLLTIAQYFTGYSPVLRSQGAMAQASTTEDVASRESLLRAAAVADPRAAEPWQELAALKLRSWLDRAGPRALREFHEASEQYLVLKPRSSSAWRQVGEWNLQIFMRTKKTEDAAAAANYLARAVELYPNSAPTRADWVASLAAVGEDAEAEQEAAKALELDDAMPHADKKLPKPVRQRLMVLAHRS
jgi:hypothetical protein